MHPAPPLLLLTAVLSLPVIASGAGPESSTSASSGHKTAALDVHRTASGHRPGHEAARSLSATGGLSTTSTATPLTRPDHAPGSGRPYTIRIEQPHTYTSQEAKVRLSYLLDYWTERFGVTQQWNGNTVLVTGKVLGIRVEAWVQVQGHRVWALAVDPGPLMRRAGERYIRKKIAKYMHPTYEEL